MLRVCAQGDRQQTVVVARHINVKFGPFPRVSKQQGAGLVDSELGIFEPVKWVIQSSTQGSDGRARQHQIATRCGEPELDGGVGHVAPFGFV